MTRIRTSHSWRTIRGMRIRIAHRRRVAVKPGSSILRPACQGMATYGGFSAAGQRLGVQGATSLGSEHPN
jgi:hypothetical protein